jgi:cytochrome b561
MTWRNTDSRYSSPSIALHWLMVLLIAAVYACMELRGFFPRGGEMRGSLRLWHYTLGLCVLGLGSVRVLLHVIGTAPRIEPPPPRWQRLLATLMHAALLLLMVGMPLLGWLTLSASGKPIPFFGLHLPALIAQSEDLADELREIHETGSTIGYFLIGLHAAAALYHHYVVRDNTLKRMLPGRA